MKKESLNASVHYNDWLGQIALDNAHKSLYDHFGNKINNEHILGFNVYIHTNHEKIGISIYTGSVSRDQETGKRTDKKHPKVKEYKTELTIQEFLKLFKRINIKVFEDLEARKDTKLTVIEEVNI